MFWLQNLTFENRSFEEYPYEITMIPLNFIDSFIKSFLNKLYTPKVIVQNIPKKIVFVKLPFLLS